MNGIGRCDVGYIANWDLQTSELLRKRFRLIEAKAYSPWYFGNLCERLYLDQTTFDFETKKIIEPICLGTKIDALVNEGETGLAELQVGARSKIFEVYAIGKGTAAVSRADFMLDDEVARIPIRASGGYLLNRGSTCFYGVFFSKDIQDAKISETAIFDSENVTIDKMLLRTKIANAVDYIDHNQGEDDISVAHVIYSQSV